jgi:hypothetical protein
MTNTPSSPIGDSAPQEGKVYLTITLLIQAALVAALAIFIWRRDWENTFLTGSVIALTLTPALLAKRYRIFVPPEFQLIAAAFVFLSLFLGSAFDYYYRFWWWDIVLHTSSGFLLGIIGFVVLFLLHRTNKVPQGMSPFFICFFGVLFAVFIGVVWEIFEFIVDKFTTANMQSRETGVDDTMHDLIVDTVGAVIVAAMGYAYAKSGRYSFIADGVQKFLQQNPRLFESRQKTQPEAKESGRRED